MEITDLSVEDQNLVNTQFPETLEKEAAAEAGAVMELYDVGFSKLAAQSADELDKIAEEHDDDDDKGEGEGKDKKDKMEYSEEEKKEAAARGAFIAKGFINGLKKQGADRHGDEFHYLAPMIQEKLASAHGYEVKPEVLEKEAKGAVSKALGKVKKYHKEMGQHLMGKGPKGGKGKGFMGKAKNVGKGALMASPYIGAGGLGAYAMTKDKKDKK